MTIDYLTINARATNLLLSAKKHTPSIDERLKTLVELRVSQVNGCSYCIDLHSREARSYGEIQQRLDCLAVWRECSLFTESEMAALQWAESLTNIAVEVNVEDKLEVLLGSFSEVEVVDLTLIVSLMNCMNRIAIPLGDKPTPQIPC